MALSELQELDLRERLEAPGLSELDELEIREQLEVGEFLVEPEPAAAAPAPGQPAPAEVGGVQGQQRQAGFLSDVLEFGEGFVDTAVQTVKEAVGTVEAGLTLASGALVEGPAGAAGAGTAALADSEAGEAVIEGTREAFTFKPRTEAGQKRLQQFGKALKPVGEGLIAAEKFLGDSVFDATDFLKPESRAFVSASAATIPTAILELLGIRSAKFLKGRQAARIEKQAAKLLDKGAPSVETLKAQSGLVFDKIDSLKATIKPKAYDAFVARITRRMDAVEGITPKSQPGTTATLSDLNRFVGGKRPLNLKRLENIRRNAKENAAASRVKGRDGDARLAESIIDDIDDWLEVSGHKVLNFPGGPPKNIGAAYTKARQLWNKAKNAEEVNEMVGRAELARSGFRPGLESQFASFLKNKKKTQFFKPEQLKIMHDFATGKTGSMDRLIHLVAGLAPTEGGVNRRTLIQLLTVAGGGFGLGVGGLVIGPALGISAALISRQKARGVATYLRNIITAGTDAGEIARAYVRNVPKAQRSAEGLGKILAERGADLTKLLDTEFQRAAGDAARAQAQVIGGLAAVPGVGQEAREQAQPAITP